MSQPELLKGVVTRLDEAGIEYMLTGSIVSSLQGEPRATHDIDIVIAVRIDPADAAISSHSSAASGAGSRRRSTLQDR
jgi:hypothetical protein